ncbi:MAG: hypothetical protein ABW051_07755 [Burkholderiaceae bacterium]
MAKQQNEQRPGKDEVKPATPPLDEPVAGGTLNFDDDEIYSGRGNNARTGGTANAKGGDSAKLGPPAEILSNRNGPSDPDR